MVTLARVALGAQLLQLVLTRYSGLIGAALIPVTLLLGIRTTRANPELARTARRAFGLSVAQELLALGVVMTDGSDHSRVMHLLVGALFAVVLAQLAFRGETKHAHASG